ncbi:hypothetical protein EVAR_71607_1 [Eumeta japonica]|uniref:Circadian clock-controlled protein n=1 Tax=Eumeta variegata TaxID=151549 RepID=A0A4C1TFU6_EUMVA|nr:hypothetical protein EVAR_71607_1 [Eumeta japonica]
MGYDPYRLPDYNRTVGVFSMQLSNTWINGISSFYRVGDVVVSMENNTITLTVKLPGFGYRKRPVINDLQIDLGNIQVRCDGAGTLDYIMEFVVNILPNLLRYQIMDALENPIKMRIQEKFNTIDVEQAIKDNIEKVRN